MSTKLITIIKSQMTDGKSMSFLTTGGIHLLNTKTSGAYGSKVGVCIINSPAAVVHQFGITASRVAFGSGGVGVMPWLPALH